MLFTPKYEYTIIKDDEYSSCMKKLTDILNSYMHTGYFKSFDSKEIYYEYIRVVNPKANIIIVHGYTEFTKKYYEIAWYLLNMGYSVYLFDARGHGKSYRHINNFELTHIENYEDYISDLNEYIRQIVIPNGEKAPLYLYGHSMGGAVAQMYISTHKDIIKKTLLSAPMIYPCTPPLPRFIIKSFIRKEAKKFGWESKFKYSSEFNPEIKMENGNDSCYSRFKYNLQLRIDNLAYRNSYGSNRWIYNAICNVDKIINKKSIKNINSSVMILIAGQDTAVNPKHQLKLAKLLNCKVKTFENSKHSLYTLPDKYLQEYVNTLLKFFDD